MSTPTLADIVQDLRIETQLRYGPAASDPEQTALILGKCVERIEPVPTPELEAAE